MQNHLQYIINDTVYMLNFGCWLERLNDELGRKFHNNGPAYCDEKVNCLIH